MWKRIFTCLCFFCNFSLKAQTIQILHTADLHSYFDGPPGTIGQGYAVLKKRMDYETRQAKRQNVATLRLDSGDFMEGNLYYMASAGLRSLEMMDLLKHDAVALGNHDFLMGAEEMEKLFKTVKPSFALLSANFQFNDESKSQHPVLSETILPYKIFRFQNQQVAVVGLTTDEALYKWRIKKEANILSPYTLGEETAAELKKSGVDVVIALSHLGLDEDRRLVRESKNIDLVLGGHTHMTMQKPLYVFNLDRRAVPVVHSGMHGSHLGKMILNLESHQLNYELIHLKGSKDREVEKHIELAREDLNTSYGKDWLEQVIATNKDSKGINAEELGPFVTEALQESAQADLAINFDSFLGTGPTQDSIRRIDLMHAHPRFFDLKRKEGWTVWKVGLYGRALKEMLRLFVQSGQKFSVAGLEYSYSQPKESDIAWKDALGVQLFSWFTKTLGPHKGLYEGPVIFDRVLIGGKDLEEFKVYTVAFSEAIVSGAIGMSTPMDYVFQSREDTGIPIWQALEQKLTHTLLQTLK